MTPLFNTRRKNVPNIDYNTMRRVCSDSPSALARRYGLTEYDTKSGKAWFKDNGANILLVAHLDSCQPFTHFSLAKLKPDTRIFCPTLDDRLGAYVILDYLGKAKVKYDILLTDNEEKRQSTARDFNFPHKRQYNWMAMFDRSGKDVVMYQYENTIAKAALTKHGFTVGKGSYSCIVELDDLGCQGFNFGIGYHDYHTTYAYASRNEIMETLNKFLRFYKEYKNVHFEYKFEEDDYYQTELPFSKYDHDSVQRPIFDIKTQKLITAGKEKETPIETKGSEDSLVTKLREIAQKAKATKKMGLATIMYQSIDFLKISDEAVRVLYENGFTLIVEICRLRGSEMLKLDGMTKVLYDEIRERLLAVGLSMWITDGELLRDYDIEVKTETSNKGKTTVYNFHSLNKVVNINDWDPGLDEVQTVEAEVMQTIQLKPLEPEEIVQIQYTPILATENARDIDRDKQKAGVLTPILLPLKRWEEQDYAFESVEGQLRWRKKTREVGFIPVL